MIAQALGTGPWQRGCRPRGQGISPQDDVPAGELDAGMLRVRQAFWAENGMWRYNPGRWAPRGVLRMLGDRKAP